MAVKCGFTELKYGSGPSRYKQNAIGYFTKGAGLLDMSHPVLLFQLKLRHHIE